MPGKENDSPISAADFLAARKANLSSRRRRQVEEERRENARERYRRAGAELLKDLASAGFPVESVSELYREYKDYSEAIPILLAWLPKLTDERVKDTVIRALTVPDALGTIAPRLIDDYRREQDETLRWQLANAILESGNRAIRKELHSLAKDESYGWSRQPLLLALARSNGEETMSTLVGLLSDETVSAYAARALGELEDVRARAALEHFASQSGGLPRKEAIKALKRLERVERKRLKPS